MRVRGERELYAALDGLVEVFEDVRKLPRGWDDNADVRLNRQRRYLDSEGGGTWPELTAGYAADKEAAVGFRSILQFSTRMYRSLIEEGAPNYVREEDGDGLRVGTSDPKARWHHEGRGRLPVREVMEASPEEGQEHLHVFRDSYAESSRALGFKVI